MFFGPELGIKIRILAHTSDDVFKGNGLDPMVNKLNVLFLGLLSLKKLTWSVSFLDGLYPKIVLRNFFMIRPLLWYTHRY